MDLDRQTLAVGNGGIDMWTYEKKLQYPVKIQNPNPAIAKFIITQVGGPDVRDPIKFLREREVVHFQRFGEALRVVQDNLNSKNFYAFNPEFDRPRNR